MGLVSNQNPAGKLFKQYTNEEKALLAKKYTPEQLKAIEAGEEAVDPEDLDNHGIIRTDIGALPYLDDFSQTRPVLDRRAPYKGPIDPNARLMTDEEVSQNLSDVANQVLQEKREEYARNPPKDLKFLEDGTPDIRTNRIDALKIESRMSDYMGTNGPIPPEHNTSFLAPGLPKKFLEDEETVKTKSEAELEDEADPRDPDGIYNRLIKQTGLTLDEILDYKVKVLVRHRVVNQTRLGKIQSIYCLAVAGNQNGRLGIGEAKGQEVEETQSNARIAAIRSMQPIPRYEERTIFGDVDGKVSAVEVQLMARPPGTYTS